jgi:O-antigen/teichoic acid export membrane protein
MRRKFASNLLFLLFANLIIKPFWIWGVDLMVQRDKVGTEMYGTYFAVFNYSFIFSILLDFGINNFNNRAISRNQNRLNEYLLNLMMIKVVFSIIYMALTFISAMATGYSEMQMKMLYILAINQVLLSVILYLRSNLAALQMFKTDSIISITDRLLAIIFCLSLMFLPMFRDGFNIMWFIYAQTAALGITALIAFVIIISRAKIVLKIWNAKYTRAILLKSAPFALLALMMGIYYRIDAIMIERMLGPAGAMEAGIYAASYRQLDAINQFGYLFATLLLPLFAFMIRKNESVAQLVKFSSELIFAVSLVLAVHCYFYRHDIMQLLFHKQDAYWADIFGWLMLSFIPISSVYVFGTLLTAKGNLKALNAIALSGMVLNIAINLVLIPKYKAFGATIATLITQVFVAIAHVVVVGRVFSFKFEAGRLAMLAVYAAAVVAICIIGPMLSLTWWVVFLASMAVCGLLGIVLKIFPLKELAAIYQNRNTGV